MLKLSELQQRKVLDEFDFAFQPDLGVRKIPDRGALAFIEARGDVALLGPPGTGKTHIAVEISVAACRAVHFDSFHQPR